MPMRYATREEEYLDDLNTRDSKALSMMLCCGADVQLVKILLKYRTTYEVLDSIIPIYARMKRDLFGRV